MGIALNAAEDSALRGLVAEARGDIIVRLNAAGVMEFASANMARLGFETAEMLLKPHIADLAHRDHQAAIRSFVAKVLEAEMEPVSIEFPVPRHDGSVEKDTASPAKLHWHALDLRSICDERGRVTGALGLLRSLDRVRNLESELNVSATVDGLTGLDNERAYLARLERMAEAGVPGTVILCDIDHFQALRLQHGRRVADDVLWAFAQFLTAMAGRDHSVARLAGERFGVLAPDLSVADARVWGNELRQTFNALTQNVSTRRSTLSISVGLAAIEGSADDALRQAQVAMVMARACGRVRGYSSEYASFER